jgi:hypothetical protein
MARRGSTVLLAILLLWGCSSGTTKRTTSQPATTRTSVPPSTVADLTTKFCEAFIGVDIATAGLTKAFEAYAKDPSTAQALLDERLAAAGSAARAVFAVAPADIAKDAEQWALAMSKLDASGGGRVAADAADSEQAVQAYRQTHC